MDRSAPNAMQHEYWNGPVGERWAARQENIDDTMRSITGALMSFAAPEPGMRVLDIGCGAGTTTLLLAAAVAPGKVMGVDISAPMLRAARARTADPRIEFVEADAALYALPADFDLAVSRFGVMFFADPAAAFSNIRKALKPGGRLAFVCWRAFEDNGWAYAPFAAARELLPPQEYGDPHAPGPFAFADGDRIRTMLGIAGFRDIGVKRRDTVMNMGATAGDAAYEALQIGPLARAARELDDETRRKIRDRITPVLDTFKTPAGIMPPASCWLVGANA